jgi:hypothetical protein
MAVAAAEEHDLISSAIWALALHSLPPSAPTPHIAVIAIASTTASVLGGALQEGNRVVRHC